MAASGAFTPDLKPLKLPSNSVYIPYASVLSPNGTKLFVADQQDGLVVINLAHPSEAPFQVLDDGKPISTALGIAVAPNGNTLYITGNPGGGPDKVFIVHLGGSKSKDSVVGEISDPSSLIKDPTALAVSHNGKLLYIGNYTPSDSKSAIAVAQLTNPTTGKVVKSEFESGLGITTALKWSPNGKLLYAADVNGPAEVLKVSGEKVTVADRLNQAEQLFGLALSPNGRTMYGDVISEGTVLGGRTPAEFETFAVAKNGLSAHLTNSVLLGTSEDALAITLSSNGKLGYVNIAKFKGDVTTGGVDEFVLPRR